MLHNGQQTDHPIMLKETHYGITKIMNEKVFIVDKEFETLIRNIGHSTL